MSNGNNLTASTPNRPTFRKRKTLAAKRIYTSGAECVCGCGGRLWSSLNGRRTTQKRGMDSIGGKRVGRTRQSTSSQQSSRRRRSRNATTGASGRTSRTPFGRSKLLLSLIAAGASTTMAQSCVPLAGSTTCPAFGKSSVSTSEKLTGLLYVPQSFDGFRIGLFFFFGPDADNFSLHPSPFLQGVSSIQNFDEQLRKHIESTYTQVK